MRDLIARIKQFIKKAIAWVLTLKLVRSFLLYIEYRGPMLADSVTYRTLFSVFAGVLLGFTIAAIWLGDNPQVIEAIVAAVDAAVPGLVGPGGVVDPEDITAPAGLTFASIASAVVLVFTAISAITALRNAMRLIAGKLRDDLPYVWKMLRNLALAIGIALALVASAVMTVLANVGVDLVANLFGVSESGPAARTLTRWAGIGVVFLLDVAVIAVLFLSLSGVKAPARALWPGALLGGAGLIVLQELSGLFVGGATSNPLLATFASLIALLLWFNLSAQVILIASAYIVVGVLESEDRVREKYGASTFAQRRVRRAEAAVQAASDELRTAREAEAKERASA
ncbi:YihY/virulence factor BrkB family protein [Microbacterium hominis]|uniref:YihY/virulence factor BrkB family protein n=1 Tax=Microbacterium hominis TaxID=162426 RepID=A0A7D4PVD0_9MICO|nr:YihY/virulence factor BrkB family protein [Microbacterium hominis]QKJ19694.1 YihY/virulence factor BrkB family protein [Microbacterium hominis]